MYSANRPFKRPAIFIFILASFVFAACGVSGANTNWPGLSTDGEIIYIAYGPGVAAYSIETHSNEPVWLFPSETNRALSFFAAPSAKDGRIILGDFGAAGGFFSPEPVVTVYALQNNEGGSYRELWQESGLAPGSIVAPPLQIGDRVFIGTADNYVYALDANTGEMLWPEPFQTGDSIWGRPAYKDGLLIINSLDRTVYAIEVESGRELWRKLMDGALASAPVVNEDLVFVTGFDSSLHALELKSGNEIWEAKAEDWIWSAPAYKDGVVYYADVKGNIFAASAKSGGEIWSQQIENPIQTSPVVADNSLFIASQGDTELGEGLLTALAIENGEQLWQITTVAPLYTTPVVVSDTIIVALQNEDALLIAFDKDTGNEQWRIRPPESQ